MKRQRARTAPKDEAEHARRIAQRLFVWTRQGVLVAAFGIAVAIAS